MDFAPVGQFAEQQFLGQRLLDLVLNQTAHRARSVEAIVALVRQPVARILVELDVDILFRQLEFELENELVDHAGHRVLAEIGEGHDRIETVAEFGREHALHRFLARILLGYVAEADAAACHVGGPGIGGHDQDDIAEIDRLAVMIGQAAIIHHLQQDVEEVRMGLLDLIQQQHAMRILVDRIGQQPALIVSDIARRRADETRHAVPLHIFRHVEALEFDPHDRGELARDLGLADAGGAGKQERADRLVRIAQARTAQLHGRRQPLDRRILSEHDMLQIAFEIFERLLIVLRNRFRRNARHRRNHRLDLARGDLLLPLGRLHQHLHRTHFIDHVDRLVGQLAIVNVARAQLHRRFQRVGGVGHLVVILERALQALQDLDRIFHRRLVHVDLLEPAQQRAVLFEVIAEFLVSGRSDAADRAAGKRRLQQVRSVHRPAAGRASADHGVDFVDEENRVRHVLQFADDLLQPLLEIAAIAGSGEQCAHVERVDYGFGQHFGDFAFHDLARQAFRDRGLPHAGIANIERIVLGPAAQDLDRAIDFRPATDQRIDLAVFRLLVEIDGELVERGFLLPVLALVGFRFGCRIFGIALRRAGIDLAAALADAVADEADCIQPAHILLLEKIDRVAVAFGKQRDQDVGAGHGVLAARLDVQDRALNHPLEARGGLGIRIVVAAQRLIFLFQILAHHCGQLAQIDATGIQHLRGIFIVDKRQQKMFERSVFVSPLGRIGERLVEGLFEILGETGHSGSFSASPQEARNGDRLDDRDEPPLYRMEPIWEALRRL